MTKPFEALGTHPKDFSVLETQPPSGLDHPLTWAKENLAAPLINGAFVDRWDGVVGTVDDLRGASQDTGKIGHLKQGDANNWTNWTTQTVMGTVGSMIAFTVAGKLTGGALRSFGAGIGAEGRWAVALKNEHIAQFAGAGLLTAAEKPKDGESRTGNVAGTLFGFAAFGAGTALSTGLSTPFKWGTRAVFGAVGGTGQEAISAGIDGRHISGHDLLRAGTMGGISGVALPKLQEWGQRGIDSVNNTLGRGVPLDRYVETKLSGEERQSPTLRANIDNNTWARVQDNSYANFADRAKNRVYLATDEATPQKLGHELFALSQNRTLKYEQQFKDVAAMLGDPANEQRALGNYKVMRRNQELDQIQVEHEIKAQIAGTSPELKFRERLAPLIGERRAYGNTTYNDVWTQEFEQFKQSGGTFRPNFEYGGDPKANKKTFEERLRDNEEMAAASKEICGVIQSGGYIGVEVGGAPRDIELSRIRRDPTIIPKDYDIASSATPEQLEALFKSRGYYIFPKGEAYGVECVVINGKQYEIATMRTEGEYSDGRRPDKVEFVTSMEADSRRRDFTINAMYRNPMTGEIYDFHGGREEDLTRGKVRAVGEPAERITEDRQRMMRGPRIAAEKNFELDPAWIAESRKRAWSLNGTETQKAISGERNRDEITKVLEGPDPARGMRLFMRAGVLKYVLPEVYRLRGPKGWQDPHHHPEGTVWTHTLMVIDALKGSGFDRVASGLFHDVGKPDTQKIFREDGRIVKISNHGHDATGADMTKVIMDRLKYPGDVIDGVSDRVRLHMLMHGLKDVRKSTLNRMLERPDIIDLIELQHADATGTTSPSRNEKSRRDWLYEQLEQMSKVENPVLKLGAPPVVTGDMLIGLGFKPGPVFKRILESSRNAQYEQEITSDMEGLRFVRENFERYRGLNVQQQNELLRLEAEEAARVANFPPDIELY